MCISSRFFAFYRINFTISNYWVIFEYQIKTKTHIMTTKEFLTENRETVITYYNQEVKGYYSISLREFMMDLMVNFKKRTIVEGLTKTDLTCNLSGAKSRLGMMDGNIRVEAFDKRTEALKRKYKGTSAMAMV